MASLRKSVNQAAKNIAVLGATAATATALTVGAVATAPPELHASQPEVALAGAYTTGPLFRLLDVLGVDLEGLIPPDLAPILAALGISEFNNIPANPLAINNTLNSIDFGSFIRTRTGVVLGIGSGSFATTRAYQALIASAAGETWDGYDPLLPGSNLNPNRTNLLLVLLRNPGRPNGGWYARFAPIADIFGIDANTPPGGQVSSTGIRLNTTIVDVSWAYDPMSDFPVTLNPFAVANSVLAGLPTNLLGGISVKGDDPVTSLATVGVWLGLAALGTAPPGSSFYFTVLPDDLPLLEPLRLPVRVVNALTGWSLPTPIANALQPAAKILVNIGYTDVVTPTDIAADPDLAGYQPYDRTFSSDELSIPTPLYTRLPLTFDEYLHVPGDTLTALLTGIVDEIRDLADHSSSEEMLSVNAKGIAAVDPQGRVQKVAGLPLPGAGQGSVDELLANAQNHVDGVSTKLSTAVEKARANMKADRAAKASSVFKFGAGDNGGQVKVERKMPVKDAVQKAGKNLKDAVRKVSAKVKKALKPKTKAAQGS